MFPETTTLRRMVMIVTNRGLIYCIILHKQTNQLKVTVKFLPQTGANLPQFYTVHNFPINRVFMNTRL